MDIIFLGTSAMVPTAERNHPAILLSYENDKILIDCGENTQRQLKIAKISANKITKLLITHWHGDHVLGIPGLVQTLAASDYNKTLEIYGPVHSNIFFENMLTTYFLKGKIKVKVYEINRDGTFLKTKNYEISARALKHNKIPCLAYSFKENDKIRVDKKYIKKLNIYGPIVGKLQKGHDIVWNGKRVKAKDATYIQKGKKIGIVLDTLLCENCYKIAKDSDVLISEAMYLDKLRDKALEYKHLTAKQAGLIAKKANVKKLVLTHFSQRYKNTNEIEKEVKKYFKNTIAAEDFTKITIKEGGFGIFKGIRSFTKEDKLEGQLKR